MVIDGRQTVEKVIEEIMNNYNRDLPNALPLHGRNSNDYDLRMVDEDDHEPDFDLPPLQVRTKYLYMQCKPVGAGFTVSCMQCSKTHSQWGGSTLSGCGLNLEWWCGFDVWVVKPTQNFVDHPSHNSRTEKKKLTDPFLALGKKKCKFFVPVF